ADAGLLAVCWLLVALAALLAVLAPRGVLRALDDGARAAVRDAGASADLVLESAPAYYGPYSIGAVQDFVDDTEFLERRLVAPLAATTGPGVAHLVVEPVDVLLRDPGVGSAVGEDAVGDDAVEGDVVEAGGLAEDAVFRTRLTMLPTATLAALRVVQGEPVTDALPPEGEPRPVALPVAWAQASDVAVGDVLWLRHFSDLGVTATTVEVTTLVEPADPSAAVWQALGWVWEEPSASADAPLLAGPAVVTQAASALGAEAMGTVVLPTDADAYTAAVAADVALQLDRITRSDVPFPGTMTNLVLARSALDETLDAYHDQARAARAQMDLAVAGAVGVAVLVLVLAARLLVARRAAATALERARGASVASVALRAAAESVPLTLAAVVPVLVLGHLLGGVPPGAAAP
ncbi:hypothetical protein, partial [Actinotalea sp. JY-7885]